MVFRTRLATVLLPFALFAQSQSSTGLVQGRVSDSLRAPIAGASVQLESEGSGARRTAKTGANGEFVFPAVTVGEYRLRVSSEGMAAVRTEEFGVAPGQASIHTFTLEPAQVVQRLEVVERPDAIQATATTQNVALGNERIEETPAPGRNYLNFVLTAPGVSPAAGSNARRSAAAIRHPAADSGFTFAGIRPRNNSLLIDGVDNRDETTGGNRVAIGLEMIAEFRVSGTSVSPEYGSGAGGAVNVVTHSGSNLYHGDFTFFTQHEAANARNPEALVDRKPRARLAQPGVSLNGPFRRNRTFFSTAVEYSRESSEEWSEAPAAGIAGANVLRGLFPASGRQTEFSFKANHQANDHHSLSARYAFSRGNVRNDVQDADNFTDRSARGSSLTRDHSLVLGWTWIANAGAVHDLRAQIAERDSLLEPNSRGPMVEIPGVLTFGQAWRLDAHRRERHVELVDNVSLVRGRHLLAVGASLHRVGLDARLANRFGGIEIYPTLAGYLARRPDVTIRAMGSPETEWSTLPVAAWFGDKWQAAPGLTIELGLRYDRQSLPAPFAESNRNFAPRVGVAWQPGFSRTGANKVVFRAGAGLFFDRAPMAFWNDALQKDGVRGWEIYNEQRAVYRPDSHLPSTYARKFTGGFEYGLDRDTTLTIEYANVAGFHLPRIRNAALRLPPVYQLEQSAQSRYQGASVSLHRRLSHELSYLAAWNGGRTRDDASDYDEHPFDPSNTRLDWARSRQHQAHRVSGTLLFEPLEGITAAPVLSWGTGRPLNALASTDLFRTGAWPISARPFGLPRNPFYSPGQFSIDIRVMKTWRVRKDRAWMQVGVEAFNLTNRTNPLRVSPYYAAGDSRLASYGGIIETLNARQIQFLAQFEY